MNCRSHPSKVRALFTIFFWRCQLDSDTRSSESPTYISFRNRGVRTDGTAYESTRAACILVSYALRRAIAIVTDSSRSHRRIDASADDAIRLQSISCPTDSVIDERVIKGPCISNANFHIVSERRPAGYSPPKAYATIVLANPSATGIAHRRHASMSRGKIAANLSDTGHGFVLKPCPRSFIARSTLWCNYVYRMEVRVRLRSACGR